MRQTITISIKLILAGDGDSLSLLYGESEEIAQTHWAFTLLRLSMQVLHLLLEIRPIVVHSPARNQ